MAKNTTKEKDTDKQEPEKEMEHTKDVVFEVESTDDIQTESDQDEVATLQARVEELEKELAGARERYIRQLAETDNFRKRITKEKEEHTKRANERLVKDLLPVLDNLQRALDAADQAGDVPKIFLDGIHMVEKDFLRILQEFGVHPVESSPGMEFDPTIHEALNQVETDEQEPGTVVRTLQRGYMYNNRLLRPALVSVATEPEHTVPGFEVNLKDIQDEDDLDEESLKEEAKQ